MGSPTLVSLNPRAIGSSLAVAAVTDLAAVDPAGMSLGTSVYVAQAAQSFVLTVSTAAIDHFSVEAVQGSTFLRWVSSGSPPYVPLPGVLSVSGMTIPNLKAWFKADVGVTFASAAAWPTINGWADQSGLGSRDLTVVGSPQFVANSINGRPGIRCNTTPSYLQSTQTLVTGDRAARTVFFVGVGRSTAGGAQVCFRIGATNNFFFQHIFTGGNVGVWGCWNQSPELISTVPPINGVPHIWEHSYDGQFAVTVGSSAARCRIDGDEQALTITNNPAGAETGTAGFLIGSRGDATSLAWDGEVSEVLVFDRVLSMAERRAVTRYLATKYGITCTDQVNVLALGDSHLAGVGDAATLAAGGPRQYLQTVRTGWCFAAGLLYGPFASVTGSPQTIPRAQAGLFNRHAGMTAFTSANNVAHGIGGKFLDDLLQYCGGADLVYLQIGCNDNVVDSLTAAQSAANIRAICETIYARLPAAQVVIVAPTKLATFHASAGTANPIIGAIPGQIEANFASNPPKNVLRSSVDGTYAIVPPVVPDTLYAANGTDSTHISVAGWKIIVDQAILPGLAARGV